MTPALIAAGVLVIALTFVGGFYLGMVTGAARTRRGPEGARFALEPLADTWDRLFIGIATVGYEARPFRRRRLYRCPVCGAVSGRLNCSYCGRRKIRMTDLELMAYDHGHRRSVRRSVKERNLCQTNQTTES